jgi:hypothetical protein
LCISGRLPLDAKTSILDEFVDRAVQVTATGQMLPGWGEMILPPAHSRLRRGIEGQIETGTDTDLKDSTSRTRYNAVAIRREHTLAAFNVGPPDRFLASARPCFYRG